MPQTGLKIYGAPARRGFTFGEHSLNPNGYVYKLGVPLHNKSPTIEGLCSGPLFLETPHWAFRLRVQVPKP